MSLYRCKLCGFEDGFTVRSGGMLGMSMDSEEQRLMSKLKKLKRMARFQSNLGTMRMERIFSSGGREVRT